MEYKPAEKKIERISKQQKQRLVEYMSSNLEFARGQFCKLNANSSSKEQWESLTVILNSLGGSGKKVEQWKKCWIDLKSGVKKTINARRKFMNQRGGGSRANVPRDLNPLEEQILQIMTVDGVDGDACTPESGLILKESFEKFESVEFLQCDETGSSPAKKPTRLSALLDANLLSTTQSYNKRKLPSSSLPKTASKYVDTLNEAREMQKALVEQLSKIE